MAIYFLLLFLGFFGGFFSGLLGLGGAILMVPMLLFVPPWFGFVPLDMKQVAALSMVQVFFSALAAVPVHNQGNAVSWPLVTSVGISSAVSTLVGALVSAYVSVQLLLGLFAGISTFAALLMLLPSTEDENEQVADQVRFNKAAAVSIGAAVGAVGGMVGAAGAFIYVPLLIHILKIPTRVALGSTLAIVLLSSLFGMVGKVASGQVLWGLAVALVVGSIPGARLGSRTSQLVNVRMLRWLVTGVIVVSTANLWGQALS